MDTPLIICLLAAAMSILSVLISWKSYSLSREYLLKKADRMDDFLDNFGEALSNLGEQQE